MGQGWGPLWLESVREGPPNNSRHSETLTPIPAVLGRERQLGLAGWWGMAACGGWGHSSVPASVSRLNPSQRCSVHRVTY